jgi:xanthine dehydrogenase YagR molybdenum-binding subunit
MTMGISVALFEQSILDPCFGDDVNHDFAEYHIATNADVGSVDVAWIDEDDPHANPLGAKGIGELGIVGTRGDRQRGLPRDWCSGPRPTNHAGQTLLT